MADPKGFLTTPQRELPARRPVDVRILDYREVYERQDPSEAAAMLTRQAGRCMDCGIPFCHDGCPLGNLIPEWNDLAWRDDWQAAIERLHATNNFPEFTGRLCPAPCEGSCVLGIASDPVTIKQVEVSIIDRAWDEGWVQPLDRLAPLVAVDEVVPLGDEVAERTPAVAERDTAVHAAAGLALELPELLLLVDLVPVLDADRDGPATGQLALASAQETLGVSHGRPP